MGKKTSLQSPSTTDMIRCLCHCTKIDYLFLEVRLTNQMSLYMDLVVHIENVSALQRIAIDGFRYAHDCTNRVLVGQDLCGNQDT